MNKDVLSKLIERFNAFLDGRTPIEYSSLRTYLDEFPSRYRFREVIAPASLFFHRQCIRSSIHGHRVKVRRAIKALKRGALDTAKRELNLAYLWIGQAQKVFEIVGFFSHFAIKDLDHYRLTARDIQSGDVILSYKTREYIRHSRLSWFVKLVSNSQITHALLAYTHPDSGPVCISSGDVTRGLGVTPITPRRGEIFIVLRPREDLRTTVIKERVAHWHEKAQARMLLSPKEQKAYFPFPEIKCQFASALSLISFPTYYTGIPLTLKNPLSKARGFFCSEFVDMVYKEAGYVLTPRGEYDAIVGPMEILYSPLLELQGVIAHSVDLLSAQDEIHGQFIG